MKSRRLKYLLPDIPAIEFLEDRCLLATPVAPTLLSPANGTQLLMPLTISWSAVSDPSGIVAYNWQVSTSSTFASVLKLGSTNGETQSVVSGLANSTYFWRVQAVNSAFVQGAWSQASSFTVTGVVPGTPAAPTLAPTQAYNTFHPFETASTEWTAVPDAATYAFETSREIRASRWPRLFRTPTLTNPLTN